jgi:hypothetical protein
VIIASLQSYLQVGKDYNCNRDRVKGIENHYRGSASARGYRKNSAYTSLKPLTGL